MVLVAAVDAAEAVVGGAEVEIMKVGLGYRRPLHHWITTSGSPECVEITAEHFFDSGADTLEQIRRSVPVYLHGLGISLGTPGPLDKETLARFKAVSDACDPEWVSEHVSFTRAGEIDLGHLNPVPRTAGSLDVLVDHAIEFGEACGKPVILENITSHLEATGDITETSFLNELCERADCGLLLDVTNLFINARNHGFDAQAWLREIEPRRIVQLHIVGYGFDGERYHDHHSAIIQDELIDLLGAVLDHAAVQAIILERDERLDQVGEIESEIRRLKSVASRSEQPEARS